MGGGGGLLGDLLAGGLGYMAGRRSQAAQYQQYPPQYQQQYPPQYQQQYPPQYQQYPPQYQQASPQYQQAAPQYQAPAPGDQNSAMAQLKLLGHLRDSGMLTNDEFEQEKQRILNGS